jgi:hypothetical protein
MIRLFKRRQKDIRITFTVPKEAATKVKEKIFPPNFLKHQEVSDNILSELLMISMSNEMKKLMS